MYHFSSSISATTITSWLLKVRLISIVNFNTINIGWNKELPLLLLFFRELQFTSYLENYNLQFTPKSKKTSIYSYFLLRQKINASPVLHICSHLLNENGGKLRFPHFWEVNWKLFFYLGDELKFTLLFTCYSKLPTLFTGFFLLSLSVEFSVFIQFTNLLNTTSLSCLDVWGSMNTEAPETIPVVSSESLFLAQKLRCCAYGSVAAFYTHFLMYSGEERVHLIFDMCIKIMELRFVI